MYYNSVIEAVGNTPLVKLQKIAKNVPGTVLAKVEYFNPGQSIKDRIAIKMIDDAEAKGLIKPGGTIIEGTSGNTGMGLALVAIQRGYKCIFTTTDKQSQSKVDILKALGAEVIVCPFTSNAPPNCGVVSSTTLLIPEPTIEVQALLLYPSIFDIVEL